MCLLLGFGLVATSWAQPGFSMHLGASLPQSDFGIGNLTGSSISGAAKGLVFGMQYANPDSDKKIGLSAGIAINFHKLLQKVQYEIIRQYGVMGAVQLEFTPHSYINIPVHLGFNRTIHIIDNLALFANAGFALNFLKITDMIIAVNNQTLLTEMPACFGVGYTVGGGLLISNVACLTINYLDLGEHHAKGTFQAFGDSFIRSRRGKIHLLTLTFGYIINPG